MRFLIITNLVAALLVGVVLAMAGLSWNSWVVWSVLSLTFVISYTSHKLGLALASYYCAASMAITLDRLGYPPEEIIKALQDFEQR